MKNIKSPLEGVLKGEKASLAIVLFLLIGVLGFLFVRQTPVGTVLVTVVIGYACYMWGFIKEKDSKND